MENGNIFNRKICYLNCFKLVILNFTAETAVKFEHFISDVERKHTVKHLTNKHIISNLKSIRQLKQWQRVFKREIKLWYSIVWWGGHKLTKCWLKNTEYACPSLWKRWVDSLIYQKASELTILLNFQYKIGQLYMIAKHSHEQSQKGEGVEVIENRPHEVRWL